MPGQQPTLNQVHVDAILTQISVAYIQDERSFISTKVFPIVPVDKKSDLYYVYTKNDWFRDEAQRRAPATESAGSGYNVGTDNYICDVFALHKDVDNQVLQNTDRPLDPFRDATRFITQKMLLRQEIQWTSDYFTAGVWDTDVTLTDTWDDYASSDPIDDVEEGKETILGTTGHEPNTLVLGYQVWRKLKNHPDIIDRIKYTRIGSPATAAELLAGLFGVERILVARAIKATNDEGAAEDYAFIQGKQALLLYVAKSPGLYEPSAGYTFAWRGVSQGIGTTIGVTRIPMRLKKAERVEAEKAWDNKVVASDMGYFWTNAVS